MIKKISNIVLKECRSGVDVPIDPNCAAFFWGNNGGIAVINKLKYLCGIPSNIKFIQHSINSSTGTVNPGIEGEYCDKPSALYDFEITAETLIDSCENVTENYAINALFQLIVTPNGEHWDYLLKIYSMSDGGSFTFDRVEVQYVNHTTEIFPYQGNPTTYFNPPQALYRRIEFDNGKLFDAVQHILEWQYRVEPVNIDGPEYENIRKFYKDNYNIVTNVVNDLVIRRIWTRNVNPIPYGPHEFPSVMFKAGHCPIVGSSLISL